MRSPAQFLNASEAAKQIGVSAKALRLYERRGLLAPARTAAGWRVYGPNELARAAEIAVLRALGLSLGEVARVLAGDASGLEPALAAHQATLESRIRQLAQSVGKVRRLRADLNSGHAPLAEEAVRLLKPVQNLSIAFALPWPWGGEQFDLRDIRPLNYITGPLGSGKTRLAKRLAETLPGASFLGLERLAERSEATRTRLHTDPALKLRVDQTIAWLVEDGGTVSEALLALLVGLECEGPAILVIDMLEQGLDKATQEAVIAYLRHRRPDARPLFILTRSNAILDLDAVAADEAIIYCPANHSPPILVAPYRGATGYEAVATCLASPEVRARTNGVIAWRPQGAEFSEATGRLDP